MIPTLPAGTAKAGRAAAIATVLLCGAMVQAQQAGEGGVLLTFGLSERVEASDNLALRTDSDGRTLQSSTSLSFALSTETRLNKLEFTGSTSYRVADRPDTGTESDLADPRFALSYDRTGANSSFGLDANYSSQDIAFLRPLEDFVTDDGTIVLPDDLDDLQGEGTRINRSVSTRLVLGADGPFGVTLSGALSDLTYRDTTSPDLNDSLRTTLRSQFRLALTEVTDATVGLSYTSFDEDGSDLRETRGLDVGLVYARPLGNLTFRLSADEAPEGTRYGARAGRRYTLPGGRLDFGLGVTRAANGGDALTGNFSYLHNLPTGQITAAAERSVTSTDNGERQITAVSVDWSRQLNTFANLGINAGFVRSEDTGSGAIVDNADLAASLGYTLAEDWSLNLGYRYRMRDETAVGSATSNSVFATVGRSFSFRP